jgi:hypothetical protein
MTLRCSPRKADTPAPNGTLRHREAKSGTTWHKAVGGWKRRLGDRSPTARRGDLWRPMALGPLGRRAAEYVAAAVSTSLPQGTRPSQLAPCGLQPHLFSRGWCTVAQDRAAICTSANGPSAKCQVARECQVPRANLALKGQVPSATWHSCTKRRSAARAGNERHQSARLDPSPECP